MSIKIRNLTLLTVMITVLAACRGPTQPIEVDLGVLVEQPSEYTGRRVTTWGMLRTFDQPRHYWIETADFQRVGVVPEQKIASYVNEMVQVSGRFDIVAGAGRQLTVEHITTYP